MTDTVQGCSLNPNEVEALERWAKGEVPTFSTGICGALTCGYGKLDDNGYWEFPLAPAEAYLSILNLRRPHEQETKNQESGNLSLVAAAESPRLSGMWST